MRENAERAGEGDGEREELFVIVARVARFFNLGRAVWKMRVGEFFAWADALPELQRQETLQAINTRVIAGQRSVKDEDYKQAMRDLGKRVRRLEKRMTPEELKAFEIRVETLNRLWRQRKG